MTMHLRPSQIAFWPLDRLKPYARNAKTHDAHQVTKIAASMAEFGWTVPCLVAADGELIAGHGRVLAAAQLGLAEAPVIVLDHLSEAQRRAYARQEWQKMRERNEALDTRVYARAAAWILGADRFDERMWRQLEKQAGIDSAAIAAAPAEQVKPDAPEAGRVTAPRRRGWKISTPRYME